jgi:hypothetical protein
MQEKLGPYLTRLRELPFVERVAVVRAEGGSGVRVDAAVELRLVDGTHARFNVEHKSSHITAAVAEQLRAMQKRSSTHWLLMAPHVGAPLGEALEQARVHFVDLAGNCRVAVGTRFLARVQGRSAAPRPREAKELRAPGYQVMFALLAAPELVSESQRAIAAAAGTSRQPVTDLIARLLAEGVLVRRKGSVAWVSGPDRVLFDWWLTGYRATLRPRLLVGRYRVPPSGEPKSVEQWLQDHATNLHFGGGAAAHQLEPYYRGPLTVVHAEPPSEAVRRKLKMLPAVDGDLVWLRPIGEVSLRGEQPHTVHPLLVHAELFADPEPRAAEAAELIRDRWLPWSRCRRKMPRPSATSNGHGPTPT